MTYFNTQIHGMLIVSILSWSACKASPPSDTNASSSDPSAASALQHDPEHPPIDCPLRRAGVDPHTLKPFEDTDKYIAFLERPERVAWQKPGQLVSSLRLAGHETVADVGAGSGYFTFRFAKVLVKGRVIAIDVEPEMIRHIHHKAMSEGIGNIEVVLGEMDDPKVPAGVHVIFVCDVLHHVKDPSAWLARLFAEAGSSTRLVVVEFKEGPLPEGPPASLKLPRDRVIELVKTAGFEHQEVNSVLLPYQYVLTFRKP